VTLRPALFLDRDGTLIVDTDFVRTPGEVVLLPGAADAVARAIDTRFDTAAIRHHAERFSRERFGDEMSALIMEPAGW